jgi:hypothetical protein
MPASREDFFWKVPKHVRRIEIDANVTVTGGFRVRYRDKANPLTIAGKNRKTSVIHGTDQSDWTATANIAEADKWRYSAISVIEDAVVHVQNLTSRNPRGYNISGYANDAVIHVERCDLIDSRGGDGNNSDGFAGSSGSTIRHSFISTSDDAIKIYHDITIENVTIEQHRNGAPLQFGWHDENDEADAIIRNLTIRGVSKERRYNMAPLTWENGQHGKRNVTIDGLDVDIEGQVYDESNSSWRPVGLLELKPAKCEFNLSVVNANIGMLEQGIRMTPGKITINKHTLPFATAK